MNPARKLAWEFAIGAARRRFVEAAKASQANQHHYGNLLEFLVHAFVEERETARILQ